MKTYPDSGLCPSVVVETMRHPAYPELLRRYRAARQMWRDNPGVQEAAKTIGMTEEHYCGAVVALQGPIVWTSASTNTSGLEWEHYHLAYVTAGGKA